jgi:hypothetical protein
MIWTQLLRIFIVWELTPCSLVERNQRLGEIFCPRFQGRRIVITVRTSNLVLRFYAEDGDNNFHRCVGKVLHGVIFQ